MKRLLALVKNPWLLTGAGLLLTYTLVGFLLVPFLIVHYTPSIVAEQIQRQASIKAVRFNPFLFKLELEDFALNELDGRPIVELRRLSVNFDLESLYHQSWVFRELVLEGPKVHVVMDEQGSVNLAHLADALPKSEAPPPPPGPPPRFLLKHFALIDGSVAYTRHSTTETLSPLNLELDDISTLPDRNGMLELNAQLEGGGAIHWDGRFTLEPTQAEGDFRLTEFNIASGWKLIDDWLNLAEPKGALSLSAHYHFKMQQDTVDLSLSKIGCKLTKLHLALADAAEPLLALDSLQLEDGEFDLGHHSVKLPANALQQAQLNVAVDPLGMMNWQHIMKANPPTAPAVTPTVQSTAPPAPPTSAATEPVPWRVEVGAFKLEKLGIAYTDASSRVPYAARIGNFGLDFAATAEIGAGEPKVGVHNLKLSLQDINIAETGPQAAPDPLLSLHHVQLEGAEFDLGAHSIKLPTWVIEKGQVQVAVDAQGGLNWQHLAKPKPAASPAPDPEPAKNAPPPAPWQLELGTFKLADVGIQFSDASRKRPYAVSIGGISLNLAAKAEVGAGEPKAQVQGLNLAINDIWLNETGHADPLLGWDSLELGNGRLDWEKHDLGIDKFALKGGGVQIQRDAAGEIELAELLAPKTAPKPTPEPPAAPGKAAPPWHVGLKAFALQGFRLAYRDDTFPSAIMYDADSLDVNLTNINYPGKTPVNVDVKLKLKQGGKLAVTGKASVTGDSADAKVQADQLNLLPLQPVVGKFAKLKMDSADFSSNVQVNFRQGDTGPAIKATGTLGLAHLLLNETVGGQRLLSWKTLAVNGIDFGLKPDHLNIKEVRIFEPGAKIAIAKDKSNNFASAFKSQPTAAPAPAKPDTPAAPVKATANPKSVASKKPSPDSAKPFPVKVERVRLDNGVIDFSDLSLVIPFTTRVHDFDGTATDISTVPNSRTTLRFTGRVEEFGEAKVDGTLLPSAFKDYSNITVIFRNVEMSSLSPYSATFAGRKITSGKLNLDLLYKIENSQLKSENKIVLEQFTLGDQVESPGAMSLPLDLAIALLKDGDGKITASVPIEGDVNNPQFSIGPVLWDAFVTLIKTAVTAPFRAIGSLLGIEANEDLGAVMFPPGNDVIPPPEREKIQKVAKALAQRPRLKLTVQGGFDPKLDGEALRSLRVRIAVGNKLEITSDGKEPLSFSDTKTQKALEDLAEDRGGAGFLDEVQTEFQQSAGHQPSRMRGMSALLNRASEDVGFYAKAFAKLVAAEPLPANELESLADRRMNQVLKELTGQPGFDPGRVALGIPTAVSDGKDGAVATQMELGAQE